MVVVSDWGKEPLRSYCLVGTGYKVPVLQDEKYSGNGWLHNSVNSLNATEL